MNKLDGTLNDPRLETIRVLASSLARGELSTRGVASPRGDVLDEIIGQLNSAMARLSQDRTDPAPMNASSDTERLEHLSDTIAALARMDFSQPFRLSKQNDIFDAIGLGLNALAEELQAVAVSRAHLEEILESIPDGLIVADALGSIDRTNGALLDLVGLPEEEIVGERVERFLACGDNTHGPATMQHDDLYGRDQRRTLLRPDGVAVPVAWSGVRLQENQGQTPGGVFVAHDLRPLLGAELRLRAALEEKDALLQEVHHRVKNNLQVITSLLRMQAIDIDDSAAVCALEQSIGRVRAMSLVHDQLYASEHLGRIDLELYLEALMAHIAATHGSGAASLSLRLSNVVVTPEVAVPIGLIANELIRNALEHGHDGSSGSVVEVSLDECERGLLSLRVQDRGPGFASDVELETGRSLGLRLASALSAQIDGELIFVNAPGCHVELRAPIA
ncbi:MAG: PAS domain S-box protein [Myxococcales bacterium]|nr:PAS domain S-box protein [Myxococcales bacterium]